MQRSKYQLVVALGDITVDDETVKSVHLSQTGEADAPEIDELSVVQHRFIDDLRAAELDTSDTRSRVLFRCAPDASPTEAVAAYVFVCFVAGRRVDFAVGETKCSVAAIDQGARDLNDAGRPETTPETLAVNGVDAEVQVNLAEAPTPEVVGMLRFARRAQVHLPDDVMSALLTFLVVAGIRARGTSERLPSVVAVDVPVELDGFRRAAAQFRRPQTATQRCVVPAVELSPRALELITAAAASPAATMIALGTTTPGLGLWHCPRPDRHTNGDANASMNVGEDTVRCFRCDAELVDPVRLVADVREVSFTEAAQWINENVIPRTAELIAQIPVEEVEESDEETSEAI